MRDITTYSCTYLGRDPDYRELNEKFTLDVVMGAQLINLFPGIFKPYVYLFLHLSGCEVLCNSHLLTSLVGQLLTKVPSSIKRAVNHIKPLVDEQLEQREKYGDDWPDKPVGWHHLAHPCLKFTLVIGE